MMDVTPADLSGPRFERVEVEDATTVVAILNDELDGASAEDLSHWSLSELGGAVIAINGAALDPDLRTLRLSVAPLTPQGTYVLHMEGVLNTAVRPTGGDDDASFTYDPDLRAHWRLNDGEFATTAENSAPFGMDAVLTGTSWVAESADGSRYSLAFDGEDDRALIGGLDVPGEELTLALWFKAESFDTADGRLISKATGLTADEHIWMLSTIQQGPDFFVRFRLRAGTTTTTLVGTVPLTTGEWTHIVAEYDGQAMTLRQNGVWMTSAPKTGLIATAPSVNAAVGDQPPGSGNRPFHGLLDDVRVYSRLLENQEILDLSVQRFGRPFCESLPNSTGQAAHASYSGSTSLIADDLTLEVAPLQPGEFGIFWYGDAQIFVPFGNGLRCVGGDVHRIFPPLLSDGAGVLRRDLNYSSLPPGGAIAPGETWNFQAWFRDPFAYGSNFNLSDGLTLTFLP